MSVKVLEVLGVSDFMSQIGEHLAVFNQVFQDQLCSGSQGALAQLRLLSEFQVSCPYKLILSRLVYIKSKA